MTVVATGLGAQVARAPLQMVEPTRSVEVEEAPDYRDLDQPTTIRRKRAASGAQNGALAPDAEGGEEYFDIPAFLRRQAD